MTVWSRMVYVRQLIAGGSTPDVLLSTSLTGIFLLCFSVGSTSAAPLAGLILERFSIRRVTRAYALFEAFAIAVLCLGAYGANFPLACLGSFMFGTGMSGFNMGMNLAGVATERRAGRTMMPRFHAFYCLGAVLSSSISLFVTHFEIPFYVQVTFVCALVVSGVFVSAHFVFKSVDVGEDAKRAEPAAVPVKKPGFKAVLDKSTIMIGLVVMACTLTEGSGNDWISSGVHESFFEGGSETPGIGALWVCLFGAFLMRFFGGHLVDKYGRRIVLRFSIVCAASGVLLFCLTPFVWVVFPAAFLWGVGIAMGYPLGISEASNSAENSALRTSVVAMIGSVVNIAGPPFLGFFSGAAGIRIALLVLPLFLVIGFFATRAFSNISKKAEPNE